MKTRDASDHIAELFRDLLPEVQRTHFEVSARTDQVIVWLVGLATASIGLLIINIDRFAFLPRPTLQVTLIVLATVVLLGVTHRLVHHVLSSHQANLIFRLRSHLYGLTWTDHGPMDLSEYWTAQEVSDHLKADFGINYDFLFESSAPIEKWRQIYKDIYSRYEEREKENLDRLRKTLADHLGLSSAEEGNLFEADGQALVLQARLARRIGRLSDALYVFTGVFFVLSVMLLTIGIAYVL